MIVAMMDEIDRIKVVCAATWDRQTAALNQQARTALEDLTAEMYAKYGRGSQAELARLTEHSSSEIGRWAQPKKP